MGPDDVRRAAVRVQQLADDVRRLAERMLTAAGGGSWRWVVYVAGTSSWFPVPGRSPLDLTGDLHLLSGVRSSGLAGLLAAMRAVGVGPHEPVVLVGHSQGGLIAAATAADPAAWREFSIQRVLTTGAPIASIPVPDDVQALAVEHTDDLVPRLDGATNQDRPNWATVSARSQAAGSNGFGAYGLGEYQRTAEQIDRSTDPSVVAWRAGTAPFLAPPASSWDVELSRVATS
jgi:pimeloyl-ACP methyl ester carboxylesterase